MQCAVQKLRKRQTERGQVPQRSAETSSSGTGGFAKSANSSCASDFRVGNCRFDSMIARDEHRVDRPRWRYHWRKSRISASSGIKILNVVGRLITGPCWLEGLHLRGTFASSAAFISGASRSLRGASTGNHRVSTGNLVMKLATMALAATFVLSGSLAYAQTTRSSPDPAPSANSTRDTTGMAPTRAIFDQVASYPAAAR